MEMKTKIVFLEDNESHYNRMKDFLEKNDCEILLDFAQTKSLIANYESMKIVSVNNIDPIRREIKEKISRLNRDNPHAFWLIDVNWTGTNEETIGGDSYGLEFCREELLSRGVDNQFYIDIKRIVIISVNPKINYANKISGLKYISKFNKKNELFSEEFELELLHYLRKREDNLNPNPYEERKL